MRKSIAILLAILMLFTLFQGAPRGNVAKSDTQPIWPMFHYNAQNNGQCPYSTLNNGGGLKWKFNVGGNGLVIGSDGTIYIGSHFFYALNPDGTLKWKYQIEELIPYPVVASDGTIYFQSMPGSSVVDAYLYAFNPDGTLKWKYRTGNCGASKIAPSIGQDGTIYVGGVELNESLYPIYYLYAINPDGTLKWKYAVDGELWVPAAISSDGTIYAQAWIYGRPRNYLYAINTDGTLKWKKDFEGIGTSSCPAISYDGTVYVGGSHYLYAISPDGAVKWEYKADFPGDFCSPVISSDGTIYSAEDIANILYAFNPDGTLKWKYEKGSWSGNDTSLAIGSDGTIYYTHGDICALNSPAPKSFRILASAGPGGSISPSGNVTVNYGDSKTFTITPNSGYHITDVKVDGVSVGPVSTYTFQNITADHTIEATFAINTYNITASAGLGGSISPSGTITVNYGDSKTFTITPNTGYHISDVKVDGKSVGAVSTYTFTNITDNHTIEVTFEKNQIIIVLQVGQAIFKVNDAASILDSPPIIKNSRTLLPIRPIVEALGGSVSWDGNEKKVTVTLGSTTIELWIGKNTARVNGTDTPIDSTNSKVVPEIINGRTMLPLRFVTENLGCQLQWDPNTQTISITYQG